MGFEEEDFKKTVQQLQRYKGVSGGTHTQTLKHLRKCTNVSLPNYEDINAFLSNCQCVCVWSIEH